MTCDHCGAPRPDGSRACPFCKAVFADAIAPGAPAPAAAPDVPAGVIESIDAGNLVQAIAIWKKEKKVGLVDAKAAVVALAQARGKG